MKSFRSFIADGWYNLITSIGTTRDKTQNTDFKKSIYLDDQILRYIWTGDGYGAKIVASPADDMTREWINISNDDENKILNKLSDLNAESEINQALKWSRLYGGGLILIGLADGKQLEEPVNPGMIKDVMYLKNFDKTQVEITPDNYNINPMDGEYGELESVNIIPNYGSMFKVHMDRLLIFKGVPVPNSETESNRDFWGMSVLQQMWDQLKDFGSAFNSVGIILQEFIVGKYTLTGLSELMANGKEQLIRDRINIIEQSKSVINSVLLDADEKYERDTASLGGIPELLYVYMSYLSGVSGIPVTRLFGRSAAGMNATGEGDMMNYYDFVKADQKNKLKKPIQKLVDYINVNEKIIDPTIEFNPLIQTSQKDEIDMKKTQADTDKLYIDLGVILPEEIRESRYANGYSFETNLEEGLWAESETEKAELKQAIIEGQAANANQESKEPIKEENEEENEKENDF